jgi:hypothetical protein
MEDRDVARLSDDKLNVSFFSGDDMVKGGGLCFFASPTIVATPFSGGSFSSIKSTSGFWISVSPPGSSASSAFWACKYYIKTSISHNSDVLHFLLPKQIYLHQSE